MASYRGIQKNPKSDGTGENKRCLRRDLNKAAALGATAAHAYKLMTESDTIDKFYNTLLGTPPPKNDPYPWGVCPPHTTDKNKATDTPRSIPPATTSTPSIPAGTPPPPRATPSSTSTTRRWTVSGGCGRCRTPTSV